MDCTKINLDMLSPLERDSQFRLLIYSHDSFGLGHIRRCQTIAAFLASRFSNLWVKILSGSPLVDKFRFSSRVDYWRLAEVIKLKDGAYVSGEDNVNLKQTLKRRSETIRDTILQFKPDLFLVDKEPLGIQGEVAESLRLLKELNIPKILGLRDVMDEPGALWKEWRRKKVLPALEELYDEIWIYGLPEIYDPLTKIPISENIRRKIQYTGYLYRQDLSTFQEEMTGSMFLVMTGGGGDGEGVVDWVLRAYEHDPSLEYDLTILLGPFMPKALQEGFKRRASRFSRIQTIEFLAAPESLIKRAKGVIAMGGYNTFCEILSFDKPALIIPRASPRQEQLLRITYASGLRLCAMLLDDGRRDPLEMSRALKALETQSAPSQYFLPRFLEGLERLTERSRYWLLASQKSDDHRVLNEV